MRLKTLENQKRVFMNPRDYEVMLQSACSRRARLVMRMMGESSLRVGKLSQDIYPGDIYQSTHPNVDLWFLPIEGKDTKKRDTDGKRREVWVPQELKEAIDEYTKINNISDDTPLFPYSKSTLQKDVERSRENAAERTGNDDYLYISAHDFRAYFATNMLLRHGVKEEVVMELGGWKDRESMDPYLNANFDDVIQDHLASAGVLDQEVEPTTKIDKLAVEISALRDAVESLDVDLTIDRDDGQTGLTDFAV